MLSENHIEQLDHFFKDDFENKLFRAAIKNLNEEYHSLTFNNFAYAIRELIRHLLHRSSPDEEIHKCSWFEYESRSKTGITRKHRFKYMIHGGLGSYVLNEMDLDADIEITCKKLLSLYDDLNSYTHIQPKTFAISFEKCQRLAQECIATVLEIISIINQIKNSVFKKIEDSIDDHLLESSFNESCIELEALARRASIEQVYTVGLKEIKLLSDRVVCTAVGTVQCYLEYGSREELCEGDETILRLSLPFQAGIIIMNERPFGEIIYIEYIGVNTESWYE